MSDSKRCFEDRDPAWVRDSCLQPKADAIHERLGVAQKAVPSRNRSDLGTSLQPSAMLPSLGLAKPRFPCPYDVWF